MEWFRDKSENVMIIPLQSEYLDEDMNLKQVNIFKTYFNDRKKGALVEVPQEKLSSS